VGPKGGDGSDLQRRGGDPITPSPAREASHSVKRRRVRPRVRASLHHMPLHAGRRSTGDAKLQDVSSGDMTLQSLPPDF
jgi:hypothetical protein